MNTATATATATATVATATSSRAASMAMGALVTMDPVANIIWHLDSIGDHSEAIQAGMLALLSELEMSTKKDIVHHDGLARIFSHEMKGADRGSLVAWVEAYSPIRISFKKNGQFEKLGWSDAHVKACRSDGRETFDLNMAAATPWYAFSPERTRAVAGGSLSKAYKSAAREIVRSAFDKDAVDPDRADLDAMVESFLADAKVRLMAEVLNYWTSDPYEAWASNRSEDLKAQARKG